MRASGMVVVPMAQLLPRQALNISLSLALAPAQVSYSIFSQRINMSEINAQRIYWHSRRGMLELDLLLMPFAREVFPSLNEAEQLLYQDFLEQEDQDLFVWLMERGQPAQARFTQIIEQILAHSRKVD